MPTLAIWGDRDPYWPDAAVPGVPVALVHGAGHHAYREQPDQVAALIVELARSLATPPE